MQKEIKALRAQVNNFEKDEKTRLLAEFDEETARKYQKLSIDELKRLVELKGSLTQAKSPYLSTTGGTKPKKITLPIEFDQNTGKMREVEVELP